MEGKLTAGRLHAKAQRLYEESQRADRLATALDHLRVAKKALASATECVKAAGATTPLTREESSALIETGAEMEDAAQKLFDVVAPRFTQIVAKDMSDYLWQLLATGAPLGYSVSQEVYGPPK